MWFHLLAAVQFEGEEQKFYTYRVTTLRQLYQQHRFIQGWIVSQQMLVWLQYHCIMCQRFGDTWIAESEEWS